MKREHQSGDGGTVELSIQNAVRNYKIHFEIVKYLILENSLNLIFGFNQNSRYPCPVYLEYISNKNHNTHRRICHITYIIYIDLF